MIDSPNATLPDGQLVRLVRMSLRGTSQFVDPVRALAELPWRLSGERPGGVEHSILRVVRHLTFWQDLYLARASGADRPSPAHDPEGWPGEEAPASATEWREAAERYARGLADAERMAGEGSLAAILPNWGGRTRLECLLGLAAHNAYHIGQVVQLRKMLGAWPPPGGGDTW